MNLHHCRFFLHHVTTKFFKPEFYIFILHHNMYCATGRSSSSIAHHCQRLLGSMDPHLLQHKRGNQNHGHFGHSLQRGHPCSGDFFYQGDHRQLSSVSCNRPQTGPSHHQHLLKILLGQQLRHHYRHISCHCSMHFRHCFRLFHWHPHHNN